MKRSRGRNRRSGGNTINANHNNPNRHYESVGPDVKIRGSAQQVLEKYQQYARDAHTSGDRVLSEAYFQFAEHYQRIVAKQAEAKDRQQPQPQPQQRGGRDDRDNRRDNRDDDSDDNSGSDADQDEATVEVTSRAPRNEDSDNDESANMKADPIKVIDAEDGAGKPEKAAEAKPKPKSDSDRPKSRRKPYRAKETSEEPEVVTDGVMKTLSRGRRKPAQAAESESAGAADSAESAAD
ncbi:DUF4167 domain-containing protein [Hyphomonas sp.]|jgi:hypothetical protein|uniref:DUF4167 domain-containing protein n=1 Tax=Hyphomonas sp. TaxID=87 RepID=UPI0039E65E71